MKLGKTCQMTPNKHTKFHGDRTIGGALTVKKVSKTNYFCIKRPQIVEHVHIFSQTHVLHII